MTAARLCIRLTPAERAEVGDLSAAVRAALRDAPTGRHVQPAESWDRPYTVRLDAEHIALLDAQRGDTPRSTYLRAIVISQPEGGPQVGK